MKSSLIRYLKIGVAGIVGGGSLYLGGHPLYLWPLLFLSGAAVAFSASINPSILEILLFSLLFVVIGFAGLIAISWSIVISIAVVIGFTLLYSVGLWIVSKQFRRKRRLFGSIALAAFFAAVDYLISLSSIGTATSPAYSPAGFLPFVQIAEITGLWGITFIIYFVGAALGLLLYRVRDYKRYIWTVLVAVLLLLGNIAFGYWRISKFEEYGSSIRTATVCLKEKEGDVIDKPATYSLEWAERYADLVRKAALDRDALLVVWPEEALKVTDATRDTLMHFLSNLSRELGIYQVVGVFDSSLSVNSAWLIAPGGELLMEYHKHHLVPYVDKADNPGADEPEVADVAGVKAGIVICNDEVFTDITRKLGRKGAQMVMDPSWDWQAVYERHAKIVPMRAVENRFSIVRSTKDGIAQLIDPAGRVLESKNTLLADKTVMVGDLPAGTGNTFYAKYGDIFAFLAIAVVLLAAII